MGTPAKAIMCAAGMLAIGAAAGALVAYIQMRRTIDFLYA